MARNCEECGSPTPKLESVTSDDGEYICLDCAQQRAEDEDEDKAAERVRDAAPELLAACKFALGSPMSAVAARALSAAIAKAEGG